MSDEGRKRTAVPGFDAREWVELWRKTIAEHPGIPTDDETMLTWFANAIMRGYDEATSHAAGPAEGLPPAESQGAPTAPQEPLREALRVAREAIDRDRTGLASALNGVRGITGGYHWLAAGEWASYDYTQHTEATLRTEIANCFDAIREVIAKALKASGALADEHCRKIDRALAAAPSAQPSGPTLHRSACGCVVDDYGQHIRRCAEHEFPIPAPPPTPQASETPLEPKFAHTHAETFADAQREFGHAQASETPAEGEDRVASLIRDAMPWTRGYRAEGYLKEALALLARRPHGR